MLQKTNLFHALPVIIIAAFLVVVVIYAWTEPSQTPPVCPAGQPGCDAPINVSVSPQIKSGALQVNGFRNIGTTVLDGNVGIGTTAPGYKLDIQGGDINVSGVYRRSGTAGVSVSCGSGNTPSGLTVSGGIITSAGSCTAIGGAGGGITQLNQGTGIILSPNPITTTGSVSADTTYLQRRVAGSCAAGSSIRVINADGSVTCEFDDVWPPSCTNREVTAYQEATVSCAGGETLMAGGCKCGAWTGVNYMTGSAPSGNGWYCSCRSTYWATAVARCCK